jgi:hypothetical protein
MIIYRDIQETDAGRVAFKGMVREGVYLVERDVHRGEFWFFVKQNVGGIVVL